jgi:hypothetical protein
MSQLKANEQYQAAVRARKSAERYMQKCPWSETAKQAVIACQKEEWFWQKRRAEEEGQQTLRL